MIENEHLDIKSLRVLTRKNPDWQELAKDCVAFANARGGRLRIGIEEGQDSPPRDQCIPTPMLEKARRRINAILCGAKGSEELGVPRPDES